VLGTLTLALVSSALSRGSDRDPLAPCWVHDMAITGAAERGQGRCGACSLEGGRSAGPRAERHLVIVEPPLFMSMASLMLGTPQPYVFMGWRPEASRALPATPPRPRAMPECLPGRPPTLPPTPSGRRRALVCTWWRWTAPG
jgi:hypothetical protein